MISAMRAPAERANALLKRTWKTLERITLDPGRSPRSPPPHSSFFTYNGPPGEKTSIDGPIFRDGLPVEAVDSSLRASGGWRPRPLQQNAGRCFQGPIPVGKGFILTDEEASVLLARTDADYRQVVRPYLDSDDIAEDPEQRARRWVIDFGNRGLEEASRFGAALQIVRQRVKPERETNSDSGFRRFWWRFGRPRIEMRNALANVKRYAVVGRHGKRFLLATVEPYVMASDATCVFAFDDDFAIGMLQAKPHVAWAWAHSSTLETRLRYTPTTVLATFAWPDSADSHQRSFVAEASRAVFARRAEICRSENIGLTDLYNAVDDGATP